MTTLPITREQALELVEKYTKDKSDLIHYLESEVIMGALANRLGENEAYWKMLGLLHDVDWGITKFDSSQHLTKAPEILRIAGFDEQFINLVLSHGYGHDCAGLKEKSRTEKTEHALACAETVTGLIHSYALMRKSLDGMEVSGLKKKLKDKKFAAGVNREIIRECEKLGLTLDEFLNIAIKAVQSISKNVGF
ncbi:HDIG domain-containing protein [Candidatus Micrarchaeota archaeon]|nr:HDIG domain-containing protein [Candidatus Micrarchaeota archaeon]MBU1166037.1 HDIG domain-containing protein [Candidatus Micrarchaeota archaeon]MBU1887352.1 HDIG domain-containing protein [Candidatus Micrarchaeota archaeon]